MRVLINRGNLSVVCFLTLIFIEVTAQNKLSLQDCINIAFENNLLLKQASLNEEISLYNLRSNRSELLPSISAQSRNNYSWGRSIDPITNSFTTTQFTSYRGSINANMILFSGLGNQKRIKSAKFDLEIDKTEIKRIKNDLTIDIALKYINILYLKEIINANFEQVKSSEKQLEIANLKFDKGQISESDLFKIKSQKSNEEFTLTENNELLESNYIDLKQMLQMPLEKEIALKEYNGLIVDPQWMSDNKFRLLDDAIMQNPSYIISNFLTKRAINEIGVARSSFFPTLSIGGSVGSLFSNNIDFDFNQQFDNNLSYEFNFSLTIPLFEKFSNKYALKEAKLLFERTKVDLEIDRNNISKIILNAMNKAISSKKKYETANESLKFAQKSYEADLLKFQLGKININEFNITKNNYINSEADLIRAKYHYLYDNAVVIFYLGSEFNFSSD